MEHGYEAVSLRYLAKRVGLRAPSLYAHFPRGKPELYAEAAERALERYRRGIEAAAQEAPTIRDALRRVASWILSQPPIDLARMVRTDLSRLPGVLQERLTARVAECLIRPLRAVVDRGVARGELSEVHAELLGPVLLVTAEGIREAERYARLPRQVLIDRLVDLLLDGARGMEA